MIDINCDMGEGIGNEAALMPYINSANIACGYHAGDEATMRHTIDLCLQHQVHIGAHPSYQDRENFGRTDRELPAEEIYRLVWEQVRTLQQIATSMGAHLHHVKPHGALYNRAAKDKTTATAIVRAIQDADPALVVFGLSGSILISVAKEMGIPTAEEVFADRSYQPDGSLTPRSHPDALIIDPQKAVLQVQQMIQEGTVTAVDGSRVPLTAETVCLHGDGPHALAFAQALFSAFGHRQQA